MNQHSLDAATEPADTRAPISECIDDRERHQQVMVAISDLATNVREAMLYAIRKQLKISSANVADGSQNISEGTIERLKKSIETDRVLLLTNGIKSVSQEDITP